MIKGKYLLAAIDGGWPKYQKEPKNHSANFLTGCQSFHTWHPVVCFEVNIVYKKVIFIANDSLNSVLIWKPSGEFTFSISLTACRVLWWQKNTYSSQKCPLKSFFKKWKRFLLSVGGKLFVGVWLFCRTGCRTETNVRKFEDKDIWENGRDIKARCECGRNPPLGMILIQDRVLQYSENQSWNKEEEYSDIESIHYCHSKAYEKALK